MSIWVYLEDENGPVKIPPHKEGGTIVVGGNTNAELNVTYNYYEVYRLFDFSLSSLNGQRAADCIVMLERLVQKLGTRTYTDYWAPTPGNAGHALNILLEWARLHPEARFRLSE